MLLPKGPVALIASAIGPLIHAVPMLLVILVEALVAPAVTPDVIAVPMHVV